jgi:hypothetical protein
MANCPICFDVMGKSPYVIQCGSVTAEGRLTHHICHTCEKDLRLRAKETEHGRTLICPFCRSEEKEYGNRTKSSYQAELSHLYRELYLLKQRPRLPPPSPRLPPPSPRPMPVVRPMSEILTEAQRMPYPGERVWCQSGNRALGVCRTAGKTSRRCSYPMGCRNYVCRECKMCTSHFPRPSSPNFIPERMEIYD